MNSSSVFLLQHVRQTSQYEDVKTIGIYTTRVAAETTVRRMSGLPGFCEYPEGFHIDEYALDKDEWTGGFGSKN